MNNGCGHTQQTVFSPYPFADDITKAALSLQLFDDHECRSRRGLNPRRPARQTVVKPTGLIKWRLATRVILNHIILIWTAPQDILNIIICGLFMVLHHHQWRLLAIELHILQTSHTFCCSLSLSSLELISFCCSSTNADSWTSCFLCSSSSVSCSSILSSYCSSFCFCLSLNSPAISDMRAAAPARSLLNACTTSPWLSACFLAWVASRLKKNIIFQGSGFQQATCL